MDNGCGFGGHISKGVDMSDNIVAESLFVSGGFFEVNIIQMPGHLVYLALFYRQAEFLLRLRELEPESSPGAKLFLRPEKLSHLL
jgi:hypothetical protein